MTLAGNQYYPISLSCLSNQFKSQTAKLKIWVAFWVAHIWYSL